MATRRRHGTLWRVDTCESCGAAILALTGASVRNSGEHLARLTQFGLATRLIQRTLLLKYAATSDIGVQQLGRSYLVKPYDDTRFSAASTEIPNAAATSAKLRPSR